MIVLPRVGILKQNVKSRYSGIPVFELREASHHGPTIVGGANMLLRKYGRALGFNWHTALEFEDLKVDI
jgi:hypothetical protein